jgi:glyoxylase-like metal-dependent hydrolase (beta-lactamase superfamily II)
VGVTAAQQGAGGRGGPFGGKPSVDAIEVEKLTDTLFVLRGGGGNTAAFVRSDGVLLVDTKLTGWGQPIIDKVKTLTNKPVTTIINTHTHFDHVNGNVEFPATVEIVTHENTKKLMQEWNPVYGVQVDNPSPFKASGGRGLPTRTFTDRLSLGSGADRVDLHYYGPAHTGGDAWVVFAAARVMHAGDTFPNKSAPIMDKNNGGSGVGYSGTLAKGAATPGVDRVITGHSAVMPIADLKEYSDFIRELVTAAQAAKKAGRTVDEFARTWKVREKFKGYAQPPEASLRSNAQVVWDETK